MSTEEEKQRALDYYYDHHEAAKESSKKRMAEKRANDPLFKERQLALKRAWYKKNSEKYKQDIEAWRKNNKDRLTTYGRKSKYKITQEQFDARFEKQGRRCAICLSEHPNWKHGWHVDHDHGCCSGDKSCGKCVRGILCQPCNHLLARARENVFILEQAKNYLTSWMTEVLGRN